MVRQIISGINSGFQRYIDIYIYDMAQSYLLNVGTSMVPYQTFFG